MLVLSSSSTVNFTFLWECHSLLRDHLLLPNKKDLCWPFADSYPISHEKRRDLGLHFTKVTSVGPLLC